MLLRGKSSFAQWRRSKLQHKNETALICKRGGDKGEKDGIHTLIPNLDCISFYKIMSNHEPAVTFIENPSLC